VDVLVAVFAVAFGLLPLIGAIVVIIVGVQRLRGRRTRADALLEGVARAHAAGVYPHSLRGFVDQPIEYGEEADRATRSATRAATIPRRRRRRTRPSAAAD
jgi:hypothetical protein